MIALRKPSLRLIFAAMALLLLATVGVVGQSAGALAAEGEVTWKVRTASNDYGADRTSYAYTVAPGATVADQIVVSNESAEALELAVYAADGYTTESGQFDLVVGGEASENIGKWAVATDGTISVPAGESITV